MVSYNNAADYQVTQYNIITGGATNVLNNVAPSATSGVPVISQGASSQPVFGTAVVAGGGTGAVTLTGVLIGNGTSAVTGNAVTQYNVLLGGASNAISSVAPSATAGIPFVSGGSAANGSFTTAVVAGGGTGDTSFTAYAPICGGTTTTGALQSGDSGISNSGYVLTSTGASSLPTWQAASGGSGFTSIATQVFTYTGAGQTYTPTGGMLYCIIECLGGGGAGGGCPANPGATFSSAAGGGAGEYARGVFTAATIGASKSVTIGAGGTGASGTTGGNGGNTTVGSTVISAFGGSGGTTGAASATQSNCLGGAGGTGGTGGSVRTSGAVGTPGVTVSATTGMGGIGGNSQYGAGGQYTISGTGNAGSGYGAGGGGGISAGSQPAQTGGAGAPGVVIITEYV